MGNSRGRWSVFVWVLAGCGGGGGGGGTPDAAVAVDAQAPPSVLVTVAAGGTVTSADGRLTLVVPPGAVSADTQVSITATAAANVPPAAVPEGVAYDLA